MTVKGSKAFKRLHGRKRRRKKASPRNRVNTLVVKGPTIVPDQMFTKLTYRGDAWINEPNGLFQTHILRGNSIFDPEFGGVSSQPLGRDQWANFYGNYQVMASKITVKCLPTGEQGNNFTLCVIPTVDPSATGIRQIEEQPYHQSRMLYVNQDNAKQINSYMKSATIFGTKDILSEEDTQAVQTQNPNQEWYWLIGASNLSLSGTGQMSLDIHYEVEYYVRYFNRKQLQRS